MIRTRGLSVLARGKNGEYADAVNVIGSSEFGGVMSAIAYCNKSKADLTFWSLNSDSLLASEIIILFS